VREGSRAETGFFIATLIAASSTFALKALFRRLMFAVSAEEFAAARYAAPIVGALAAAFIVSAIAVLIARRDIL
jgi:hypothetical protein